jgi:hypothetical protein
MPYPLPPTRRRGPAALLVLGLFAGLCLPGPRSDAAPKKKPADAAPSAGAKAAPPAAPSGTIGDEAWRKASHEPLHPGEIDRLVNAELKADQMQPAPLTTDEQFVRRVTLDLTGELPAPADVTEFVADKEPNKRSRLIDQLCP